jgi:hypothetical protein
MSPRKRFVTIFLFVCLVGSGAIFPAKSKRQSVELQQWGPAVAGLQLSLSASNSKTENGRELQVAFRNTGEHDVTLNLGLMLANGKEQLPFNISLRLMDAQGKTRTFKFVDRKHAGIAGRVDDYIVPLRAGSVYSLRLTLDQFWCAETKEFDVKLSPGRNQFTAQFEGSEPKHVNQDLSAIKLMNFWLGNVQSKALVLER